MSLFLSLLAHTSLREQSRGAGGGCCLEAAMKDSDEGAVVQYTRRHLSNDGENTSHRHREHITKAQSFKFSLSLSTSPILIRTGKRTFSQPRGSYMNERTQTQRTARHPLLSMSLHRQIHGGQTQTKGNWTQGWLILASSHVHSSVTSWTIDGLPYQGSLTAVRFLLGKAANSQKIYKPNDVRCHPWPL